MLTRPRLSDNVEAGVDRDGTLHFVFVNARTHMTVRSDPVTTGLVCRMDGTRTIEQLAESTGGAASADQVTDLVRRMSEHRLLVQGRPDRAGPEAPHDRQLAFFSDFMPDPTVAQDALARSRVLIIGLGTIGGMIADHLARAGVGSIRAVDPDTVAETNLARHALFEHTDVGRRKIDAARDRLLARCPGLRIETECRAIESVQDVEATVGDADIVVDCADQPSVARTSEWVGRACMRRRVPHVLCGGYRTHLGFVGPTVLPGQSACWKCFETDYLENDLFGKSGWTPLPVSRPTGGSLGPLGAVVAGLHAWEAIRVLTGLVPPRMLNCKAEIDFVTLTLQFYQVAANPACSECASAGHRADSSFCGRSLPEKGSRALRGGPTPAVGLK